MSDATDLQAEQEQALVDAAATVAKDEAIIAKAEDVQAQLAPEPEIEAQPEAEPAAPLYREHGRLGVEGGA